MNEEMITQWMRQRIEQVGFTDATTLAESFLSAHRINDALAPEFSLSLDVGYKIAQEIRDQQLAHAAG